MAVCGWWQHVLVKCACVLSTVWPLVCVCSVADVASAALRDLGLLYTDKDGGGVADDLGAAGGDD